MKIKNQSILTPLILQRGILPENWSMGLQKSSEEVSGDLFDIIALSPTYDPFLPIVRT